MNTFIHPILSHAKKKDSVLSKNTELSRQQIIEYVHQWGSSSVVETILDPFCQIYSDSTIPGLIGYYENRRCALVFGDPVCAPEYQEKLAKSFHMICEKKKKNIIYLVASENFARWMQSEYGSALITYGHELFVDPSCDPTKNSGKKGISLRGKIRHAEKSKVIIREYIGENAELEQQIEEVATQWLGNRQGPQIYISRVRLFHERFGKRWFFAQQGEKLVASMVLNQLKAKEGWVLDRIMTIPNAPQGTSELLVVSVMEALAKEGCKFLTFGTTNATTLGFIEGFGKCSTFLAPRFYKVALKIFNLQRRGKYWEKFHPESCLSYIVFKQPRLGIYEIQCLLKALNISLFNK